MQTETVWMTKPAYFKNFLTSLDSKVQEEKWNTLFRWTRAHIIPRLQCPSRNSNDIDNHTLWSPQSSKNRAFCFPRLWPQSLSHQSISWNNTVPIAYQVSDVVIYLQEHQLMRLVLLSYILFSRCHFTPYAEPEILIFLVKILLVFHKMGSRVGPWWYAVCRSKFRKNTVLRPELGEVVCIMPDSYSGLAWPDLRGINWETFSETAFYLLEYKSKPPLYLAAFQVPHGRSFPYT